MNSGKGKVEAMGNVGQETETDCSTVSFFLFLLFYLSLYKATTCIISSCVLSNRFCMRKIMKRHTMT